MTHFDFTSNVLIIKLQDILEARYRGNRHFALQGQRRTAALLRATIHHDFVKMLAVTAKHNNVKILLPVNTWFLRVLELLK